MSQQSLPYLNNQVLHKNDNNPTTNLNLPTIPSFQGSWVTNSPVAATPVSPSPEKSNSEETTPKTSSSPLERGTIGATQLLTFSRRQYNPNQGIFLSQDPITQGITYNPLSTLNSNIRGNNQIIGVSHQDIGNIGLNPYTLGGQNSLSSREWDGYLNWECLDVENCKTFDFDLSDPTTNQITTIQCVKFEQCTADLNNFNSNVKTNANNKLTELKNQLKETNLKQRNFETEQQSKIISLKSKIDQLLASDGYYTTKTIVPSYIDFAQSTAKAQVDNFASDLAFSQFCKTDTIYPYQCNTYHSTLAKNYSESYSPYTSAFKKYQSLNTKTIKIHNPDAQAKDWNALTGLYYQLSNASSINQNTNEDYALWIEDAELIVSNINNNQLETKKQSTKYAECKIDTLCSNGIPSDIADQAFDAVIKEDLDKCGGKRDAGEWYWRAGHCALIAYDVVDLILGGPGPETALKVSAIQGFRKIGSKADDVVDAGSTLLKACGTRVGVDEEIDKKDALALLFGGVEVEAAGNCVIGYPNIDGLESVTSPFNKSNHLVSGSLTQKQIIQGTKNGPAKYFGSLSEVQSLEKTALQNGIVLNDATLIYDTGKIVGATEGVTSQYIRVDISAGTYHSHPITATQYNAYIKKL